MSGKKAKAARQAARSEASLPARGAGVFWLSWKGGLVGLAAVVVVAASFVLPEAFDRQSAPVASHAAGTAASFDGDGLDPGSPVPAFAERDVETGRAITSATVRARKTLLFFSEGVMCQACFVQIRDLERMSAELDKRGVDLVSITPDSPADLEQAIRQYGITSPMIADENRDMSAAFDTLGRGMHADTPGHAFALIEEGKVLWYRDYWLPPSRTMYVEPATLLADLPA